MPLRGKASAKTYGSGVFIIMHSLETVFLSTNIYVILPWYVRMLPSASEKISQSYIEYSYSMVIGYTCHSR